jgi:hypothetical protein
MLQNTNVDHNLFMGVDIVTGDILGTSVAILQQCLQETKLKIFIDYIMYFYTHCLTYIHT